MLIHPISSAFALALLPLVQRHRELRGMVLDLSSQKEVNVNIFSESLNCAMKILVILERKNMHNMYARAHTNIHKCMQDSYTCI